jgi:hypothetical protein
MVEYEKTHRREILVKIILDLNSCIPPFRGREEPS